MSSRFQCSLPLEVATRGPRHHFFGYYDLCPWDVSERFLLALETDFIDHMPGGEEKAVVGVVDTRDARFHRVGETTAWNFQQACRMQWIPGMPGHFAYNLREGDRFVAAIVDTEGHLERMLPAPLYAISPDGRHALSVDFARLQNLGGYGYPGLDDPRAAEAAPREAGISRIDLRSGAHELVLSAAEVASFGQGRAAQQGHHYIPMVSFNPSGTRICFLHRFWLSDGGFYTRLLTANPDGSELHLLSEGTLSHFSWFDDERILIWGRHRPLVAAARRRNVFANPLLKPFLDLLRKQTRGFVRQRVIGDRYLLLRDRTREVGSVGLGPLSEDGHPTRFAASRWLLTDTYPDEDHLRTLILFDLERNQRIDVGRFHALPDAEHWVDEWGERWEISAMRSDLHPRWSRDGRRICLDSIHEGTKQLYVVDVEPIVSGS